MNSIIMILPYWEVILRTVSLHRVIITSLCFFLLFSCTREEVAVSDLENLQDNAALLDNTVSQPGPPAYTAGVPGGTYTSALLDDPKTFNTLTARDASTRSVIDRLFSSLADYDPYTREFIPNAAESFEITTDEAAGTLTVTFTLRDTLLWTTPDGTIREPVSADDVVFWYNEIEGDSDLQQPGYAQQFIDMPDGSKERITIRKISSLQFAFDFPRIIANPILSSNMSFGPRYLYEPAKQAGGIPAIRDLLDISTDVNTIPSMGAFHIVEYAPAKFVKLQRNPDFWKKDDYGRNLPYIETLILRIVPDVNTSFLMFQEGETDAYSPRPEDLPVLLEEASPDYTVYNGGPSLSSSFIVFNQNPATVPEPKLSWFSHTSFRQAMSSLLNRERIVKQVYRGLAEPAVHFFAKPNPYFDPAITLAFTYKPDSAIALLENMGITPGADQLMYDSDGNHIEFDILVSTETDISMAIITIFADELRSIGITANIVPMDFQSIVSRLTESYVWDSTIVGLGANYWPTSGSNVWQSNGNFHLWHPLQETPATEWEERIDDLYNQGRFTLDTQAAKALYDEYQTILLRELPVIYIVHPLSFMSMRNRWNNIFYDNLNGTDLHYLYRE